MFRRLAHVAHGGRGAEAVVTGLVQPSAADTALVLPGRRRNCIYNGWYRSSYIIDLPCQPNGNRCSARTDSGATIRRR